MTKEVIDWNNTVERFCVIMNNKMVESGHAGKATCSMTYNDLKAVWYDWAEEMTREEWFEYVENNDELKEAFNTVLSIIQDLHNVKTIKCTNGTLYKITI